MARRSRATDKFRREVNVRYPDRPRYSDGWIGDPAHQARNSDHNKNEAGVVQAEDVTVTREQGNALFQELRLSRDRRIKYAIYNGQMFSSYATSSYPAWALRPYNGENKHANHLHLSVQDESWLYDDDSPWGIAETTSLYVEDDIVEEVIGQIQRGLVNAGYDLGKTGPKGDGVDGAWGNLTQRALNDVFIKANNSTGGGSHGGLNVADADKRYVKRGSTVRID